MKVLIPGPPMAQPRPRFYRRGNIVVVVDPQTAKNWKAAAKVHMNAAMDGRLPFEGPLALTVTAIFPCPKPHLKKRPWPRRWHASKKDIDNICKAVMDAGTGVLYLDDGQVCQLTATKIVGAQSEPPCVELELMPLEPIDPEHPGEDPPPKPRKPKKPHYHKRWVRLIREELERNPRR